MTDKDLAKLSKEVYSQFNKQELQKVAKELEISASANETTRNLATAILKDLQENGIPEDLAEASDTLYDLLVAAEYIDENGNVLGEEETVAEGESVSVNLPEMEIPDWICFSYADPRDPSCNKCKLYDPCWKKRVEKRPACFGKMYNRSEQECQSCIEAPYCVKETENG